MTHCAPGVFRRVAVVRGDVEFFRRMALQADAVAVRAQLKAVRIVAVAAGDAGMEHAALQERAVFIDLVTDLTVGKIQIVVEQRHAITVADRRARRRGGPDRPAPRMAMRAGFDLDRRLRGALRTLLPVAGSCVQTTPFRSSERNDEAFVGVHRLPARVLARPGGVGGAGAVAALAGHSISE